MVITENGAAFDDTPDDSGFVTDTDRTAYFTAHLTAVAQAIHQGADIRGYLAWSLLDNTPNTPPCTSGTQPPGTGRGEQ